MANQVSYDGNMSVTKFPLQAIISRSTVTQCQSTRTLFITDNYETSQYLIRQFYKKRKSCLWAVKVGTEQFLKSCNNIFLYCLDWENTSSGDIKALISPLEVFSQSKQNVELCDLYIYKRKTVFSLIMKHKEKQHKRTLVQYPYSDQLNCHA